MLFKVTSTTNNNPVSRRFLSTVASTTSASHFSSSSSSSSASASATPQQISSLRNNGSKSGPKAFKTDRQRRLMYREKTQLELLFENEERELQKLKNVGNNNNNEQKNTKKRKNITPGMKPTKEQQIQEAFRKIRREEVVQDGFEEEDVEEEENDVLSAENKKFEESYLELSKQQQKFNTKSKKRTQQQQQQQKVSKDHQQEEEKEKENGNDDVFGFSEDFDNTSSSFNDNKSFHSLPKTENEILHASMQQENVRGRKKAIEATMEYMREHLGPGDNRVDLPSSSSSSRKKSKNNNNELQIVNEQQGGENNNNNVIEGEEELHPLFASLDSVRRKNVKVRKPMLVEQQEQTEKNKNKNKTTNELDQEEETNSSSSSTGRDKYDMKAILAEKLQQHQQEKQQKQEKQKQEEKEKEKNLSSAKSTTSSTEQQKEEENTNNNNNDNSLTLSTTTAETSSMTNHFSLENVINDVGANKLDEIELARSGALAKRVKRQIPLPIYATDTETAQSVDFFPDSLRKNNNKNNKNENDDDDNEDMITIQHEESSKALKKFRAEQLQQLSEIFLKEKDGDDYFEESFSRVEKNGSENYSHDDEAIFFRKQSNEGKEKLKGTEAGSFVASEYRGDEFKELKELKKKVEQLEQEKNNKKNNNKKSSSSSMSSSTTTRSKTEKIGTAETRTRIPTSEIISRQHSPSNRFSTELSAATTILPQRRFAPEELEPQSEIVQRRKELAVVSEEIYSDERQTMSPLDAHVDVTFEKQIRQALMNYYKRYPINGMIRATNVVIGGIQDDDTGKVHRFDEIDRPHLPIARARKVAAEHGKDLIQVSQFEDAKKHPSLGGTGGCAVCYIADHLGYAMSDIEHRLHRSGIGNITPSQLRPLLDIGFRGCTHDFAIRVKSIYVAKFLYKQFPVRIILTKFGTFREGFPIFERVLTFIQKECERMKSYFVAGQVRYDANSIYVYLHPSTVKMPLTSIDIPSSSSLKETYEQAVFDTEYDREVAIPESFSRHNPEGRNKYLKSLEDGTAWGYRDGGLSLSRQRRLKIMQAFIPKGNKELYSRRGDVNMNWPYGSHSATGTDAISYPRETNLEQAERGAGVLARRAMMTVSETLDKNELPHETHTLGKMSFMIAGDVLEAGEMKEAFGIKRNRKKLPRLASGNATLGQGDNDGKQGDIQRF